MPGGVIAPPGTGVALRSAGLRRSMMTALPAKDCSTASLAETSGSVGRRVSSARACSPVASGMSREKIDSAANTSAAPSHGRRLFKTCLRREDMDGEAWLEIRSAIAIGSNTQAGAEETLHGVPGHMGFDGDLLARAVICWHVGQLEI